MYNNDLLPPPLEWVYSKIPKDTQHFYIFKNRKLRKVYQDEDQAYYYLQNKFNEDDIEDYQIYTNVYIDQYGNYYEIICNVA